jgi:hypothetical protein
MNVKLIVFLVVIAVVCAERYSVGISGVSGIQPGAFLFPFLLFVFVFIFCFFLFFCFFIIYFCVVLCSILLVGTRVYVYS